MSVAFNRSTGSPVVKVQIDNVEMVIEDAELDIYRPTPNALVDVRIRGRLVDRDVLEQLK